MYSSRPTNEISTSRDKLTKRSLTFPGSIRDEICWYQSVSKYNSNINSYIPKIYKFDFGSDPYIEMEIIDCLNFGEEVVQGNFDISYIEEKIECILTVWKDLFFNNVQFEDSEDKLLKCRYQYIEKIHERMILSEVFFQQHHSLISRSKINLNLNGQKKIITGWSALRDQYANAIDQICIRPHWSLMHGDFHAMNILITSETFKLVDPRGSFGGQQGCVGDARLDLAKFFHSFNGSYCQLASNNFQINFSNDEYLVQFSDKFDYISVLLKIQTLFDKLFPEIDMKDILLIEAGLFLSMIPFHFDNVDRQVACFLMGLSLANDALAE